MLAAQLADLVRVFEGAVFDPVDANGGFEIPVVLPIACVGCEFPVWVFLFQVYCDGGW